MSGEEIAWRTLCFERVGEPCLLTSWVTKAEFFERVTGRSLWDDPTGVACEAFVKLGANLCPQLVVPHSPTEFRVGDFRPGYDACREQWRSAEQVRQAIEELPGASELERGFEFEKTRDGYAEYMRALRARTCEQILWIGGFGQADFMGGYTRWGYENYLECMARYPEHLRRYYEYTGEQARLQNAAIAASIREQGLAPFVYGGQDICFRDGPICSPAWLREHYFPHLQRAVQPLLAEDIKIIWHCDGNILPILDDLIELGVSGFQGFEEEHGPTLERMAAVRTRWGRKPILWGSISVTRTLPFGTVEEVRREVERCFDVAGPGGGFGLASTSSILPETPTANILAMFEHGHAYGRAVLSEGG